MDAFLPGSEKMTEQGQFGDNGHSPPPSTYVCQECFLIQTSETSTIFDKQSYLSSFSSTWLVDMKDHLDKIFKTFDLIGNSLVVELVDHRENSTSGTNKDRFFGSKSLHSLIDFYGMADKINCKAELACVDDINDFMAGIKSFLKPDGMASLEFLHLIPLMDSSAPQVLCSKHFPYFSFTTIDKIVKQHRLEIANVEECAPKGSLRIQLKHKENVSRKISNSVLFLRGRERDLGMSYIGYYSKLRNNALEQNDYHLLGSPVDVLV